jgi:molecular chaperone GrpE
MEDLKKGIYRHYKGNEYRILMTAMNSDTKEETIIYQDVSRPEKIWTRPKTEFLSTVEVAGETKSRFEFLSEEEEEPWEHKYKRALADYQNLVKQTAKEKAEFAKYALADFLYSLLPAFDHLKMSLNGLSDEERKNPWAEGVNHVLKQFRRVLADYGLEEIKTAGEKFDPETMEAIEGSGEIIAEEIMPGYKLNGKVIRPAKVIVEPADK